MRHFRAISAGAYFALFCMPHLSAKGNANFDQTTVFGTLNMNHSKHNGENNSEVPCSFQGRLIVFCLFFFFPNCIFRILFTDFPVGCFSKRGWNFLTKYPFWDKYLFWTDKYFTFFSFNDVGLRGADVPFRFQQGRDGEIWPRSPENEGAKHSMTNQIRGSYKKRWYFYEQDEEFA